MGIRTLNVYQRNSNGFKLFARMYIIQRKLTSEDEEDVQSPKAKGSDSQTRIGVASRFQNTKTMGYRDWERRDHPQLSVLWHTNPGFTLQIDWKCKRRCKIDFIYLDLVPNLLLVLTSYIIQYTSATHSHKHRYQESKVGMA